MTIPRSVLSVIGAYAPGGTDAGTAIIPLYADARVIFPLLPGDEEIEPDTPAGSWGLAWYLGQNQQGLPKFAVRDDVVLNTKIGFHESGHAFEDELVHRIAAQTGVGLDSAMDQVRTAYWNFRSFPGTWQGAVALANQQPGSGGAWPYFPGESLAEAFSAAVSGYVQSEWTATYGKDLALTWWTPPGNGYDPQGGGLRARAFFESLAAEVDMDEATVRQIANQAAQEQIARLAADVGFEIDAKTWISKEAHHKHTVVASNGQPTDMTTTEPVLR